MRSSMLITAIASLTLVACGGGMMIDPDIIDPTLTPTPVMVTLPPPSGVSPFGFESGPLFEQLIPSGSSLDRAEVNSGTEGILYALDGWGSPLLRHVSTSSTDRYWFSFEHNPPYGLYFPSSGEGANFLSDWQVPVTNGEEQIIIDAATFSPSTENPWGLNLKAHIVSVEPNHGKGGRGLHFVATDLDILDGEPGYPESVTNIINEARSKFDLYVTQANRRLIFQTLYEDASTVADPCQDNATQQDFAQDIGFWPTWLPESKMLKVTFVHQASGQWVRFSEAGILDLGLNKRCADASEACSQIAPPPFEQPIYDRYGVEEAVVYLFDVDGNLVSETAYPAESWVDRGIPTTEDAALMDIDPTIPLPFVEFVLVDPASSDSEALCEAQVIASDTSNGRQRGLTGTANTREDGAASCTFVGRHFDHATYNISVRVQGREETSIIGMEVSPDACHNRSSKAQRILRPSSDECHDGYTLEDGQCLSPSGCAFPLLQQIIQSGNPIIDEETGILSARPPRLACVERCSILLHLDPLEIPSVCPRIATP